MFSVLESSNNELYLSILKALLITKFRPELSIQKQFYTLILFNNPFEPKEVNITPANSTGLRIFFSPSPSPCFLVGHYPKFEFLTY